MRTPWDAHVLSFSNTCSSRTRGVLLPSGSKLSSQVCTDARRGKMCNVKACLYTCVCTIISSSWKEIFFFSFFFLLQRKKIFGLFQSEVVIAFKQGCHSWDNFMLTVWNSLLGGCGSEMSKNIFSWFDLLFTCGPNNAFLLNFSWTIIPNCLMQPQSSRNVQNKYAYKFFKLCWVKKKKSLLQNAAQFLFKFKCMGLNDSSDH